MLTLGEKPVPTTRFSPAVADWRIWRGAGVSRTAECCESQRFLEDHKQPDLLGAWDNSHRRVSAEQFGDTAASEDVCFPM